MTLGGPLHTVQFSDRVLEWKNMARKSNSKDKHEPKTTYFQFENPKHPETRNLNTSEEAYDMFQAARFLQDKLGDKSNIVIGHFLIGIQELEDNNNSKPLEKLFTQLTQERSIPNEKMHQDNGTNGDDDETESNHADSLDKVKAKYTKDEIGLSKLESELEKLLK